jgi:hypothetical protein
MRAHIIDNGIVTNTIEVESLDFLPNLVEATEGSIGWLYDGQTFTPPPPPIKTPEELQAEIVEATQKRLDDFARTRNYDGILSACTYASSSVPKFAAEGQYCVDARDNTWATLYTILAEVQAGTRPVPGGFADIEPDLPVLVWPA